MINLVDVMVVVDVIVMLMFISLFLFLLCVSGIWAILTFLALFSFRLKQI